MISVIIFAVLGIACLAYYIVMVNYAGFSTAFSKEWLIMALFLIALAVVIYILHRHNIKIKTWIKTVAGIAAGIVLALFLVVEGMIIAAMNRPVEDRLDYIIVLGAQVRGTKVTASLKQRLDRAYTYLVDNGDTVAIVSGGQGTGEDISEAQCMKNYLVDRGIDEARVIMEDKSTNTDENIEFSMELVADKNSSVGIVTNNFHVFRAVRICNKKGYAVNGIAARTGNCLFANYMVREFFAVVKYKLSGQI